jgi:hypothetical protein
MRSRQPRSSRWSSLSRRTVIVPLPLYPSFSGLVAVSRAFVLVSRELSSSALGIIHANRSARDERVEHLWRKLDPQNKGELDFNGLKKGLIRIDHRKQYRIRPAGTK